MAEYTVNKLAKLAGVSVRTLHHYDSIGLLKPSKRTDAGYRVYREKDLLRLQQIMFYIELEFPLKKIKAIINKHGFDMVRALEGHRKMLLERNERTKKLVETIDRTIKNMKEEKTMLKDEDLYEGFSKKEIKEITDEVTRKYDPKVVKESYDNVRKMTKEQFAAAKKEGEDIARGLASIMDMDPSGKEAQDLIARHFAHLNNYYKPTPGMYRGLGNLYVTDGRFRAYYDKYKKGLSDFINKAIGIFCDRGEK